LRYLALGTLLGGYGGEELFDADYWYGRLQLLLLYLSPVHQGLLPFGVKLGLLAINLLLLFLAVKALLRETGGSDLLSFLLLWMLLSFLPTYAAPFSENGWLYLQDSRLLYEPSAGLAVLLGMFAVSLAKGNAPLAAVFLSITAAVHGLIAWQNAEPWLRMGQASEAVRIEMQAWQGERFEERWLADLPGVEQGAYLFLAPEPILNPAVFPPDLQTKVKLLRRSQWRDLMRRVDRALSEGRAEELALYRFSLADMSITPVAQPAGFPFSLGDGVQLRYARSGQIRIRAGDAVPIQFLLAGSPPAGLTLQVEMTLAGRAIASASQRVQDSMGSWLLPTARDLPAGSYRLRLSIAGQPGVEACDLGELQVLGR
ncbi:MAG: hypothetical protein ACYTG5_19760, partial [Planctomycetota bacterium]